MSLGMQRFFGRRTAGSSLLGSNSGLGTGAGWDVVRFATTIPPNGDGPRSVKPKTRKAARKTTTSTSALVSSTSPEAGLGPVSIADGGSSFTLPVTASGLMTEARRNFSQSWHDPEAAAAGDYDDFGYDDAYEHDSESQFTLPSNVEDFTGHYLPPDHAADEKPPIGASLFNGNGLVQDISQRMAQFHTESNVTRGRKGNSNGKRASPKSAKTLKLDQEELAVAAAAEQKARDREEHNVVGNWLRKDERGAAVVGATFARPKATKMGRKTSLEKADQAAQEEQEELDSLHLSPEKKQRKKEARRLKGARQALDEETKAAAAAMKLHGIQTSLYAEEESALWALPSEIEAESVLESRNQEESSGEQDEEGEGGGSPSSTFDPAVFFGVQKPIVINKVADRVPYLTPRERAEEGQKPLQTRLVDAYARAIASDTFAHRQLHGLGFRPEDGDISVETPSASGSANQVGGAFHLSSATSPEQLAYLARFFTTVHMTGALQLPLNFGQHYSSTMPQLSHLRFPLSSGVVITTTDTKVKGLYAVTNYTVKTLTCSSDQGEEGSTLIVGATMAQIARTEDVLASVNKHNRQLASSGTTLVEEEEDDECEEVHATT